MSDDLVEDGVLDLTRMSVAEVLARYDGPEASLAAGHAAPAQSRPQHGLYPAQMARRALRRRLPAGADGHLPA